MSASAGDVAASRLSPKLGKLIRISQTVSATLDISEVLKRSLELEKDIVDAETGSILFLDESGEYLEFAVALGNAEHILKNHRVRVGEGIAGYVAKSREPMLIANVESDERFNAYFDSKTGFQTRSVLCVPIQTMDRLIGVAQVINRVDGGAFTEEDLVLFQAFAGTLAVAIENARLHRHLLDQEKIRQEITAARQVQESYLPREFPAVPGFEFSGKLLPARQVSGDFYDAFLLPDGRAAVLVGDVSGKGLPAALYMCRFLTEARAALKHGASPAGALAAVNSAICEQSTRGMFVTLILFVLDAPARRLTVVNAGHLPFFHRSGGVWAQVTSAKNPPLGIVSGRSFAASEMDISADAQILAFTDGVTEARKPDGELFGTGRLKALLDANRLPPRRLCEKIVLDIEGFTDGGEPSDDTTLITLGGAVSSSGGGIQFEIGSHPRFLGLIRNCAADLLAGVDGKIISEIQVALTEAVTNVIRHTYKNDQTQKIQLGMRRATSQFEVVVRDFGARVDLAKLVGRALEDVRPGGLGVHFIKTVFNTVEYDTSVGDGNKLILRKSIS